MRRNLRMIAMVVFVLALCVGFARAQAPNTLVYQGRLTDNTGGPIIIPTNVVFRIFDATNLGTNLWEETVNVSPDANGIFTVELGLVNPIGPNVFDGSVRYLEMEIVSEGTPMTPRQIISSAPYSIRTLGAPGIAQDRVNLVNTINNTMTDLAVVTITIPTSGYIVVLGSTGIEVCGAGGGYTYVQIDETAGGGQTSGYWSAPGMTTNPGTGCFDWSASANRVYAKSAGTYTFRLEASSSWSGTTVRAYSPSVTAVFFPNAYGAVSTVVPGSEAGMFESAVKLLQADAPPGSAGFGEDEEVYQVDLRGLEGDIRD